MCAPVLYPGIVIVETRCRLRLCRSSKTRASEDEDCAPSNLTSTAIAHVNVLSLETIDR